LANGSQVEHVIWVFYCPLMHSRTYKYVKMFYCSIQVNEFILWYLFKLKNQFKCVFLICSSSDFIDCNVNTLFWGWSLHKLFISSGIYIHEALTLCIEWKSHICVHFLLIRMVWSDTLTQHKKMCLI